MKRLNTIILLVALLICAFALTVSAESLDWSDITEVEGMSDKAAFGADGTVGATSRVLMSDGKTFPAYYIFKDSTTMSIDFNELKTKGHTYTAASVVRLEIPNGIETLISLKGKGYSNLLEVKVPEGVKTVVANFLYEVATVTSVTLPSTIESIGNGAFYSIGAAKSFVIPNGCTNVGEKAFKISGIESVVIPTTVETLGVEAFYECKNLTSVICGAASIGSMAFKNCTSITSIVLENTETIASQAFFDAGPIKSVVIPEGCISIGEKAFKSSEILSVTVPSTLTTIGTEAFEACESLKSVYYYATFTGTRMYYGCTAMETLVLDRVVEIKSFSFYGCNSIKELNFPNTLTTIGDYAFSKITVDELLIPASVSSIGNYAFYGNTNLKKAVVLGSCLAAAIFNGCSNLTEVVVTSKLTVCDVDETVTSPFNGTSQSSFVTYFVGDDISTLVSIASGDMRIKGSNVTQCTYENYLNGNYDTTKKYVIVYSANLCEVAYDQHLDDNNPCVINCERCGLNGVAEENPVHKESLTVIYDRFDRAGKKGVVCTNEGCTHQVTNDVDAVFNLLGFSVATYGSCGMSLSYSVNQKALNEYKELTGNDVVFGVFAALATTIGNGEAVNADGTYANGVVGADVSKTSNKAFEIKITGIETKENKAAALVLGAYVIVTGEGEGSVSYIQAVDAPAGEKYYAVSFDQLV